MNKNSKYGPQSFEGMELQKEDHHPVAPSQHDGYEDILLTKKIVDVKKELTELSAELADKLKAVSEKNQSQIQTLEEVLSKLEQVMKKLWEAGGYVDEMLDDIKRYKDKGLELSDNAQKQFQAFIIKLTGSIHETLTNEADLFDKRLNDIVTQQQNTLDKLKDDLKKKYDDEIKELSNNYAQLTAKTERLNDRILIPRKDFWALMLLSSVIFLGGFISWVKFWRVPGNDVTMSWMVAAGIMEFIYIISTGLNTLIYREETKGESTKKDDDKEEIRLYSVSLSQALYFMLLTLAAGVYVVWYALDCYASPAWMKYLLPVALALNFIWMMLNGILARIFSSEK
jgi:hypothetical protein